MPPVYCAKPVIIMNLPNQASQALIDEVSQLLPEMEGHLLSLNKDSSTPLYSILRIINSLKLEIAQVDWQGIETIVDRMERYFDILSQNNEVIVVDEELQKHLLEDFYCLKSALEEQVETGTYNPEWETKSNLVVEHLKLKLGDFWEDDSLANIGTEMILSIFECDVTEGIAHLEEIVTTLSEEELKEEVCLQIEVFLDFSQMLKMSGFRQILETASSAIAHNPDQIKEITHLLIADVNNVQEQVLAGEYQNEGSPSPELLEYVEGLGEEQNLNQSEEELINFASWQEEEVEQEEELIDFGNWGTQESESFFELTDNTENSDNLSSEFADNDNFDILEDPFADYSLEEDSQAQQQELEAQAYEFYIEEAKDLISLIDTGLEKVILEPDNINEINEIARAAHSLKGGARSSGLEDLGNIALRVEKSFKALFNDNINLDEELTIYLREIYQLLREPLTARLESREFDEKNALDEANALWATFEAKYGEELAKGEDFLPSSQDLGIDIATSIFEVDVVQGIESIRDDFDSGDDNALRENLTMQLEVFTGFGEMLNLPGFTEICQVTGKALEQQPEQLRAIASAFLTNIEIAKNQVLEGDRETGGKVSQELLTLAQLDTAPEPVIDYYEAPVDINDQGYSFFVEEAPELLAMMEEGLLTLKEEYTNAKIHSIMRSAHSIKGGAASVGLEAIKTISHRFEDIIKAFYNQTVEIDTDIEGLLLEGYDCLRNALMEQIETGIYDSAQALTNAQVVWTKIEARLGDLLNRPDDFMPSSEDLGVDIVQSMFEVDVLQELERLRLVLVNPTDQPLAGELRATLEVFSGFGEMLNLSGFAQIAQLGLTALENNPDRTTEIIEAIIKDADNARDLVLNGDRTTGGEPSDQLINLAQLASITEDSHEVFYLEEESMEEESLEKVFGTVTSTPEEIGNFPFDEEDNKETQTNELSSLDQVFGVEIDDSQIAAMQNAIDEEEEEENIISIEEVFAAELNEQEIDLLAKASELSLEEDKDSTIPSLDDVFNSPDLSALEIPAEDTQEEIVPSLRDVFGERITFTSVEEAAQEEEKGDQPPSLEALFGKMTPEKVSLSEDDKDTLNNEGEIKNNQEIFPEPNTENLSETIKSVEDIYSKLPGLKDDAPINFSPPVKKSKVQQPVTPQKTPTAPVKSNLTVRVDLERLERMNNLIGELSINRNGLSLQNDKLQNSVRDLLERFGRFQLTANTLRELSDRMLTSADQFNPVQGESASSFLSDDDEINLTSAFDSLEMDRYDNLYYVVQGLMDQMIQLEEAVDDIALFAGQSGQVVENQRQMLNRMRDELMWARMLPLGEVLNRFPRVLRDLSVKYQKKVDLKLSGTNVLVDKAALEKLYDPLVHLIRNGFDHGIETPQVRKQKGKSETGILEVKAYHQGNQTIIEVKDDGDGLNLQKIGAKAVERGLLTPEQLAVASKENLLDLIFQPGFSTAAQVTEMSGRGVGLDIVRSQLMSLKGTIAVDSTPNQGTTFTLKLPLTLTIDKLLVLSADNHFYALPSDNIEEIVVPEPEQLKTSGNKRFLHFENNILPIYGLQDLLEYRCYVPDNSNITTQALEVLPTPDDWGQPLLIIRQGQQLFAIEVNHLLSEQELVIKPFGNALSAPSYTYGCTILGDGTLIPVINTALLLEKFFDLTQPGASLNLLTPSVANDTSQNTSIFRATSVLVVDDSAAMRRTLALSLEKSGYRVLQAKDGKEAIDQLQQSNNISLVICDIEMPNMNGFEFLGQRRRFPELSKIPVAMLTSRSNEKHQKLAAHLGADAYFTKPYIEQKFLQAIKNLIPDKSPVTAQ